jgi:hypothetical protein
MNADKRGKKTGDYERHEQKKKIRVSPRSSASHFLNLALDQILLMVVRAGVKRLHPGRVNAGVIGCQKRGLMLHLTARAPARTKTNHRVFPL